MRIQQINHGEFESSVARAHYRWLTDRLDRISELPQYPMSRILAAVEGGRMVAVLGFSMNWTCSGTPDRAAILICAVDPRYETTGICSRLRRFAEGISRINGFQGIDVAPDVCPGNVYRKLEAEWTSTSTGPAGNQSIGSW